MTDELWMQYALTLSQYSEGKTAPNPMVGAVLVFNNKVIGQGWHEQYGAAHAEVNCIQSVKAEQRHLIMESTMYVTLEPCSHYGKTPPCASFLVAQRVKKVVIACADSFSKVNGTGIDLLKKNGIEVVIGVLEKEARWVNRRFFNFHENQRPYIILKWAATMDGKIGTGTEERLLISNDLSNRWVHKLRAQQQAIIVGAHTVNLDNPLLDTRNNADINPPLKIVLDRNGISNPAARLYHQGNNTLLFTEEASCKNQYEGNTKVEVITFKHNMESMLHSLYLRNIQSVLVEGGQSVLNRFIQSGYWDEAFVIRGKGNYSGSGIAAPILSNAVYKDTFQLKNDTIEFSVNKDNDYDL